jgi:hypothetical protein
LPTDKNNFNKNREVLSHIVATERLQASLIKRWLADDFLHVRVATRKAGLEYLKKMHNIEFS